MVPTRVVIVKISTVRDKVKIITRIKVCEYRDTDRNREMEIKVKIITRI